MEEGRLLNKTKLLPNIVKKERNKIRFVYENNVTSIRIYPILSILYYNK